MVPERMPKPSFRFKRFTVVQDRCAMKVSTDGVLFGAWVDFADAKQVLDIGTGTGLLALIAAQRAPSAHIDAVEIDPGAAAQAAENVAASPWPHRIRVHAMDVRRMHSAHAFDLIVCNPPYYAGYAAAADPRMGLAKHSGELHLDALIQAVDRLLTPTGRFALILPLNREAELVKLAATVGLAPVRRCVVRYVPQRPPKRVLLELDRSGGSVREEELCVERTGPFDYSPEYRALLAELMLNF